MCIMLSVVNFYQLLHVVACKISNMFFICKVEPGKDITLCIKTNYSALSYFSSLCCDADNNTIDIGHTNDVLISKT